MSAAPLSAEPTAETSAGAPAPRPTVKQHAARLVERLPDDATWEDVLERIDLFRMIERGRDDLDAGRVHTTDEVRRRLGLPR